MPSINTLPDVSSTANVNASLSYCCLKNVHGFWVWIAALMLTLTSGLTLVYGVSTLLGSNIAV